MTTFSEILSAHPQLLSRVTALGFSEPTDIQKLSLSETLAGQDIVGCAQTGTGKTLAFALPILKSLLADSQTQALILCPTRELAIQIETFWREFVGLSQSLSSCLVIGGANMERQHRTLMRSPRIIIATPGRLNDHLQQGKLRLDRVQTLVLDEADRMLDMGFAPQIERIIMKLSKQRQTLLFTATWDERLMGLARQHQRSPKVLSVTSQIKLAENVTQSFVKADVMEKNVSLLETAKTLNGQFIVFARTKARTERVARALYQAGFPTSFIHGDRSQGQRRRAIEEFKAGETQCLVATDIASRGLDISTIENVVNYDLPDSPEEYIHRIGRTARAGRSGAAVSIVSAEDFPLWRPIQKMLSDAGEPSPAWPFETAGRSFSQPRPFGRGGRSSGGRRPQRGSGPRSGGFGDGQQSSGQRRSFGGRRAEGGGSGYSAGNASGYAPRYSSGPSEGFKPERTYGGDGRSSGDSRPSGGGFRSRRPSTPRPRFSGPRSAAPKA